MLGFLMVKLFFSLRVQVACISENWTPKIFHNNLTVTAHLLVIFGRDDCQSVIY